MILAVVVDRVPASVERLSDSCLNNAGTAYMRYIIQHDPTSSVLRAVLSGVRVLVLEGSLFKDQVVLRHGLDH